ncbi:MAG: 1-(5-phosphoribosyl)-5-[(5-phosphoribosylamino)methylideneamino]imidazole-4-carboxamide isomerase [Oscillospiraceae bacterium]
MIILPAIDIKDGNCVRLYKGDFATVEKVAESYLETALSFYEAGAQWIHMVDLDGAKTAVPQNSKIFNHVAALGKLKVELGGGIRDMKTVEYYLQKGIARVILGSAAVSNPEFVKQAVKEYGEKIAVGIDAKNEFVAAEGWLDTSTVHYIELAKSMEQAGVSCIIYTDISKDGTLSGPNLEHLERLSNAVSCNIIASGGISDIEDIKNLKSMNLYGAICGKSIYKGTLDLKQAINLSQEG